MDKLNIDKEDIKKYFEMDAIFFKRAELSKVLLSLKLSGYSKYIETLEKLYLFESVIPRLIEESS